MATDEYTGMIEAEYKARIELVIEAYQKLNGLNQEHDLLKLGNIRDNSFLLTEGFRERYKFEPENPGAQLDALITYEDELAIAIIREERDRSIKK